MKARHTSLMFVEKERAYQSGGAALLDSNLENIININRHP
jgi:hypothetical protein